MNLQGAFGHFVEHALKSSEDSIGAQHVSNYATKLGAHEVGRFGTLDGLLKKWGELSLPGVERGLRHILVGAQEALTQEGRSG